MHIGQQTRATSSVPSRADAVIVGAGIMGLATAWWLARAGVRAVVLDKGQAGHQQSTRAWGFVRQTGRDPAEVRLSQAALRLWPSLPQALQTDILWRQEGCMFAAGTATDEAGLEAMMRVARDYQQPTRLLSGAETASIAPYLAERPRAAIYTEDDGQAEPRLTTPAFARAARRLGAVILEHCGALRVETTAGRISGVQTEHGRIAAPTVVLAAGASTHSLLRGLGLFLPQQVARGTVLRTSAAPAIGGLAFCGLGVSFRQRPDGRLNVSQDINSDLDLTLGTLRGWRLFLPGLALHWRHFGFSLGRPFLDDLHARLRPRSEAATLHGPRDPAIPPNRARAARAMRRLAELVPHAAGLHIEESWGGYIDVTPDALPVIDALPELPGLLVATGFSGHGFALGPIVGQVLSDWITAGRPKQDMHAFRFSRFAEGDIKAPYSL